MPYIVPAGRVGLQLSCIGLDLRRYTSTTSFMLLSPFLELEGPVREGSAMGRDGTDVFFGCQMINATGKKLQ